MEKEQISADEFREQFRLGMIIQDKKGRLKMNKDNVLGIEKILKKNILKKNKKSKPKKQKPTCPITGIEYDSMGEIYISWWLNELQDKGFIKEWSAQPDSFVLTEKITRDIIIEKQLKTKVKIIKKKETILPGHIYTADFKILWNDKAFKYNIVKEFDIKDTTPKDALFYTFNKVSFLEAKPDGLDLKKTPDPRNMVRLFSNKQKEVYDKYGILVELVYHNNLFNKSFVPFRYISKDKAKGNRAIKYNIKLLNQFIKED